MISMFNTGYDLQNQLDGVKNGIAIVATNNTHIAITSGQYVYIQDNSTLAEGLYKATSNIAANATLSSSNVTAVSGGGLNALNSNLSKHYVQIPSQPGSDVWESVKATLTLYPYYAFLSLGDSVTIAGGYLGNYTYALNFTRTQSNFQVGTMQDGTSVYPFTFDNSTNTLNH